MLIDTGASVTILRNDIYENLLSKPKTESVRASLVNATGELSPFYGKAYMKLNIGGKPYEPGKYRKKLWKDMEIMKER